MESPAKTDEGAEKSPQSETAKVDSDGESTEAQPNGESTEAVESDASAIRLSNPSGHDGSLQAVYTC